LFIYITKLLCCISGRALLSTLTSRILSSWKAQAHCRCQCGSVSAWILSELVAARACTWSVWLIPEQVSCFWLARRSVRLAGRDMSINVYPAPRSQELLGSSDRSFLRCFKRCSYRAAATQPHLQVPVEYGVYSCIQEPWAAAIEPWDIWERFSETQDVNVRVGCRRHGGLLSRQQTGVHYALGTAQKCEVHATSTNCKLDIASPMAAGCYRRALSCPARVRLFQKLSDFQVHLKIPDFMSTGPASPRDTSTMHRNLNHVDTCWCVPGTRVFWHFIGRTIF